MDKELDNFLHLIISYNKYRYLAYLKLKGNGMSSKIGVKLGVDVDSWRFTRGILNDEEQLGHDLYNVPGLEDKVSLPLDCFRRQTARNIPLTPQFPCW